MQGLEKQVEMCELKKAACRVLIENPTKAIRDFPYCLNSCEGYDTQCQNYVPAVIQQQGPATTSGYDRFLKVSRAYFRV